MDKATCHKAGLKKSDRLFDRDPPPSSQAQNPDWSQSRPDFQLLLMTEKRKRVRSRDIDSDFFLKSRTYIDVVDK